MSKRLHALLLVCILTPVLLTGCWNQKEPNNLAILNSIVYDLRDDGQYRVIAEILNPSGPGGQEGGGGKSPNLTAISQAENVRIALAQISQSIESILFGSHNKVRFFTESFMQGDMPAALDFLLRDHLTDETPLMVLIRAQDPVEIYSASLGLSDTVGDYIDKLSKLQAKNMPKAVFITTLDFIKDYLLEGKEPVMGVVELVECEEKSTSEDKTGEQGGKEHGPKLQYEGLAAFREGRFAGYLDGTETRAYNLITGNLKSAYYSIAAGDGVTVLEVDKAKAGITANVDGDEISFDIQLNMNIGVIEEGGTVDVSKDEPLDVIESAFNAMLIKELGAAVEKVQHELKSDIFGFGAVLRMQHPETWKQVKEQWNDTFSVCPVRISVVSDVDRTGEIKEPFLTEDQ